MASRKYRQSQKGKASIARAHKSPDYIAYQLVYHRQYGKRPDRHLYECERKKRRAATDQRFHLAGLLRSRLRSVVSGRRRTASAIRDLGCSVAYLVEHLEQQFSPGMSWANHGNGVGRWNIDHKIPLASVDLTSREQLLRVCHYTNLQPLWSTDNIRKGNRIPEGAIG